MAKQLSKTESKITLGVAGLNTKHGNFYSDEFIPELKGNKAIKVYRQMRDNDATVGASLYAVEQVLRDVPVNVEPSIKDDKVAEEYAQFVREVFDDMDHTLDDHISEALSYLTYGFAWHEVVFKQRVGPQERSRKKRSKFTDGHYGVRKIAPRAPWTINKFDINEDGEVVGVYQNTSFSVKGSQYLPKEKSLYYRTPTINNDPSGRSILRNAYTSWYRLKSLEHIEAVGIERDLNGIPHARIPADYLSPDASEDNQAFVEEVKKILRDTKFNEQGFFITPSDPYTDADGKPTNMRLVDIELMTTGTGGKNVDISPVINRYQHMIARSVLSEFIMLGSSNTGSYALSKTKTDLFLRALESYFQTIVDVLQKQLVQMLWDINGFPVEYMPKLVAGDVAPHDLKELGSYLRNLNGADINLSNQLDIIDQLLLNAELSPLDREQYKKDQERKAEIEDKRFTSDGVENSSSKDPDKEETNGGTEDE